MKLLENVVAQWLQFHLEESQSFLDNQFGGRVGRSCDDTTTTLTSILQETQKQHHVTAMLSVDIANFYGNISHDLV